MSAEIILILVSIWFKIFIKVHIFWEGHKIWQNLHGKFDRYYIGQIYGGDFAKFCGPLRINELYLMCLNLNWINCNFHTSNFKLKVKVKMNLPNFTGLLEPKFHEFNSRNISVCIMICTWILPNYSNFHKSA